MEHVGLVEKTEDAAGCVECLEALGGSDNVELVGNEKAVITKLVEDTYEELYQDDDESVVVTEAELAFPDAFRVYSKVLNIEPEKLNETEFKGMLTGILLGMAAGLRRDPTVILRMEGDDLRDFISGQSFESDAVCIFSHIEAPDKALCGYLTDAFGKLTVNHGMPPTSDSWVMSKIVAPVLESRAADELDARPISQEAFLMEFKKAALDVAQRLKAQPVIVVHNENIFDGSGIRRLLSNKFELDKVLSSALQAVAQNHDGKISKDHLPLAINAVALSADLPPIGTVDQMDKALTDSLSKLKVNDESPIDEKEYKKMLTQVLESLMLNLEADPITLTSDSVVHEYLDSDSSLLPVPSATS